MTARGGSIGTAAVGTISAYGNQCIIARATLPGAGSLSGDVLRTRDFLYARLAGAGELSFEAAITQINYLHPDADSVDGGWTNEVGGTNLFASIDESWPANDADYIQSVMNPSADLCRVRMSDPSAALTAPVRVRTKYYSRGAGQGSLTVRLKQGATQIAAWTHSPTDVPGVSVDELTAPQLAAISDPTDLFLEFDATSSYYVGPGDVVEGATAFWGLRAYSATSIGMNVVRLREDGGNTEQDFVSITGGGLDLSAISTFKGANNLFIVTFYDQSGNGYDATQSTSSQQAQFTLSAVGALPGADYIAASNHQYVIDSGFTAPTPFSLSVVGNAPTDAGGNHDFVCSAGVGDLQFRMRGGTGQLELDKSGTAIIVLSTGAFGDSTWRTGMLTYDAANYAFYIDGSVSGTAAETTALGSAGPYRLGGPSAWDNFMNELIVWGSILDATQAAAIDANQVAYGYT